MNFKKLAAAAALSFCLSAAFSSVQAAEGYVRPLPASPITAGKTVLGSTQPVIAVPLGVLTAARR